MRTIKELLQLMLDNQDMFPDGLCWWASALYNAQYISSEEYTALKKYILENKPDHVDTRYWWRACDIEPRIAWIEEQIKKLENEND